VLAYGLAWLGWPLYNLGLLPQPVLPLGTSFAAIVVSLASEGRQATGEMLKRWLNFRRASPSWYLVAALFLPGLLFTPVVVLAWLILNHSNAEATSIAFKQLLRHWYAPLVIAPYYLLSPTSGALGEEPGYCGYFVPKMLKGSDKLLRTGLVVGLMWVGWHLPVFLTDKLTQLYCIPHTLLLLEQAVIYVWLYRACHYCVPVAVVFHASLNSLSYWLFPLFGDAAGLELWWWGQVVVTGTVICTLVFAARRLVRIRL
jgi:hypothetical protein